MTNRKLHRREFLKLLGSGVAALPALNGLHVLADSIGASSPVALSPDPIENTAEARMVESIRLQLEALFEGHEMGLDFRRIDQNGQENFRIQINANQYYPVASAFKAFLVLHYFINTPQDEWQYDQTSLVYRVAVYSNNGATGHLLAEMGERVPGDGNAIEKFNDFLLDELHLQNGLYSWNWPNTPTYNQYDERFAPNQERQVWVRENAQMVSNVTTAEDLARGYEYIVYAENNPRWNSSHFREAIRISREILSIPANGYLSPIEKVVNSGYIGKDGTLPLGDLEIGRVINDAGLIRVPTGTYLVSFMSAGENESTTEPALQAVIDSMRLYEARNHPPGATYISGRSHELYPGYNYGFVRRQNVRLFSAPDARAPQIDNPVRRNTVFGMMYLMQGALVRFEAVDNEWGRIVKDDDIDDSFTYMDWTLGFSEANWRFDPPREIYVRIADLLVIGREHFEPIGFVTGAPEDTDKFIILDVPRRQLTLFEGETPILKTPVVLNMGATPRGRLYVNRGLITRNMPHYPGVPFTNFLHDGTNLNSEGYALHGAPWHRWSETVTRRETIRRYSHGCINLPNWEQTVGDFTVPVDEFVFRWTGGFPNPESERHYIRANTIVRVYSHNNVYQDVFAYQPPDSVLRSGKGWNEILNALDQKEVSAPPSFFEPTLL